MNIRFNHTQFVQCLAPVWALMLKTPAALTMGCVGDDPGITVKRAGRNLTQHDNEQLATAAWVRGGEQNVNIQFGFLGGIGGVGVPGESTG